MLNTARLLVLGGLLCAMAGRGSVRAQSAAAPEMRPLIVGFLNEGSDLPDAPALMDQLRANLEHNANLTSALRSAAYAGITLSPCDGPRDMAQRMSVGEFDLAFPTATIYARQSGGYLPILQTHLPGDFMPPGRQGGVQRRGVVFAGMKSDLARDLADKTLTGPAREAKLREQLARGPIAVTSAESAAGYIFPRVKLMQSYGVTIQTPFLFCGDDAEVIKNVVSGLVPFGACRKGEIAALLPDADQSAKLLVQLFETDYFPTDPVVVRAEFNPAQNVVGSELKAALRQFFNIALKPANGLRLEDTSPADYEALGPLLQAGVPAGLPGKPMLPASSATSPTLPKAAPLAPDAQPALPPISALNARGDRS